jgi:transmembrane sensor
MGNIFRFSSRRQIRNKAAVWIARIDRELTDQERQSLKHWLSDSPRHREALAKAGQLWRGMDVLAKLSTLFPLAGLKSRTRRPN